MSSSDPTRGNRVRWFLAATIIVLLIVAGVSLAIYPRWQASQWKEELQTTADALDAILLIQKMIRAESPHADAVLVELSGSNPNAVFAQEHRVVLLLSPDRGQPHSATRWSADTMSPNIIARFVKPRIVENIPEAVTIAATNERNGSMCLFIYTYKHTDYVCDLSSEELIEFQKNGYWNEYVARQGDPVAKKQATWTQPEVESWQRWKASVEAAFGLQAVKQQMSSRPDTAADTRTIGDHPSASGIEPQLSDLGESDE